MNNCKKDKSQQKWLGQNLTQYLADKLMCTNCRGRLRSNLGGYECWECGRKYNIQNRVPVFWDSSDEFKNAESEYYGREALTPSQSSVFRSYYRFTAYERKIKEISLSFLKPHSLVLTLGGGDGRHGVSLCQMGHDVLETDLAPLAGLAAAKKFQEADCRNSWAVAAVDAEQIPFEEESFDAIYICAALHQMPNRHKVAEQAGRVLKKGGTLILAAEPNAWFYKILRPLAQFIGIRSKQLWGQSVGDEANRGVSYEDIIRFCDRAGLKPEYIQPKFFLTGLLYQSTEAFYRLLPNNYREHLGTRQWEIDLLTRMDFIIGLIPGIQRYPFYWTVVAKKT